VSPVLFEAQGLSNSQEHPSAAKAGELFARLYGAALSRSPKVSSTAFDAQPPDLPPVSLMDMGFALALH
jgi:hypothetical protein